MSYYVWGSGRTYLDYLQDKSFSDDVKRATKEAGEGVSMEISRQTREIIASNESLARQNIRMIQASTDSITQGLADIESSYQAGIDRLSYVMQEISSGIAELNSTFHWGFGHLIAGIGH